MKKVIILLLLLLKLCTSFSQYDVCIYGGTSAGIIAAYTAAKLNKKVLLIEPGKHLGGVTSGGLGNTDIGNKSVITGLAENFYRRVGKHYGHFESFVFEPHVAEQVFNQYITEANIQVLYKYNIVSALKTDGYIKSISIQNVDSSSIFKTITAAMFIDCSYEGDLMARANVSYVVGRESSSQYNESLNGAQTPGDKQFTNVSPYKIKGDSTSGLLWGISNGTLESPGSADKQLQAYNYRVCLTKYSANKIEITRPANYDSTKYQLLARLIAAYKLTNLTSILKIDLMPDGKSDVNNTGSFSTDMIGMNYDYPDGSYAIRNNIIQAHTDYTKGLLYFIGHDISMPDTLKKQMLKWGYPKDEYTDNNNWTPQLYVRESRRLAGSYIMTQANCKSSISVDDGVGFGAYALDSHNTERLVLSGKVRNEGDIDSSVTMPYSISYQALIPKNTECKNLYVPVCLSASHIAYGSIRMEPVFMVLGESCAAAACMAIDSSKSVQDINIKQLQSLLTNNPLMDGSLPEILVDDADTLHSSFKGDWIIETKQGYGATWRHTAAKSDSQQAIFKPCLQQSCTYDVYSYISHVDSPALQTHYIINTGTTTKSVWVKDSVLISGQSHGNWVFLGSYLLPTGTAASVTVDASNSNGKIIADAVLFIPKNTCKIQQNVYVKN